MVPIFRSNYSLTSILTLEAASNEPLPENQPDSIFDIAKELSLKECYIVDNTLTGLVEAYENAKKSNISLRFGYRVNVCKDLNDKTPGSELTQSKVIIFSTRKSFTDLIKLHNISTTLGLYNGKPRLDFNCLKENWTKNLHISIPFYDSYLYYNLLYGKQCVPELDFTCPSYLLEDNDLPFDQLLGKHIKSTIQNNEIVPCKTIYYKSRKDFKAYMTYRCILNRTTFQKPELKHFGSQEFCAESFKEKLQNAKQST